MANANNEDINIYVVTYNCNNMKLTGDNPSIENFVTSVIKNNVPKLNENLEPAKVQSASSAEASETPAEESAPKPEAAAEASETPAEESAPKPEAAAEASETPAAIAEVITGEKTGVNTEDNTGVKINEKNIFIFGIQEAPKIINMPYPKMLNNITTNLKTNNNIYIYKSYYFDKTTISNTKLFIIYNVNNIDIVDEKFIDLSGSKQNRFNKHALRVTIRHNKQKILTVITTHLRKGNLAPFFINDLKEVFKGDVYNDNIILFGDLNSRTLYKEPGSNIFESYNDANLNNSNSIAANLKTLNKIPLSFLHNKDTHFINTLKHKNYYKVNLPGKSINFNNATYTLKNPTYRYDKTKTPPTLNYRKTKKKVKVLGKVLRIFQRSKDKSKYKVKDKSKFKVPSYPDRVLYKSDNKLTVIKDSAHVLNYVGSDHLPVIVKFKYEIEQAQTNNIYFMRHGHSCSNFVNDLQTQKKYKQLQSDPHNITHKNLQFIAKKIKKTHILIKNPNLSYTGYLQTQNFIKWRITNNANNSANNIFKLNNNNNLIVFCSPLVRAMETAFFSYPISIINENNITYRTFSYKYYNFDGKLNNITELNSNYIYVLPFIKEVGPTPDNTMPSIIDSKKKILNFLDLINITNKPDPLFIGDEATNLKFINKLTTNYQDLLKQFINKLPKNNDNNYVFVSHNHFIKSYLKYKDPITNTMILNSYRTTIYKPEHITNENENENENICISGVNINSTLSNTLTKPVSEISEVASEAAPAAKESAAEVASAVTSDSTAEESEVTATTPSEATTTATVAALFNSLPNNSNYTIQLNNANKPSIKINDKDIQLDDLIKHMKDTPIQNPPENLKKAIKQYVQSKNTNASTLSFDTKKFLFEHNYFAGGGKKKLSKKLFIKNKKQTKKNKLTNK
jgi:hypothetical protein